MMKEKRLAIAVLLKLLMIATLLTACSGNSEKPTANSNSNSNGNKQQREEEGFVFAEDPVDFSYYVHYDWWTTEPWGVNPNSKWVQENLQVNVKPIQSGGAAEQKLS